MSGIDYTPTQARLMAVFEDFAGHTPEELCRCLADDLGPASNLRNHVMRLRAKLVRRGLSIVCEVYPRVEYRLERVRERVPVNG